MKKILTVLTFVLFSIAIHAQSWSVAGSFNGWNNALDGLWDDGTHGDAVSADGIFTGQVTVAAAGRYEWKVVLWGNWGTAYPGPNCWFYTTVPNQVVTFTFNTNTLSDTWFPKTNIVNVDDNAGPVVACGTHQGWNNAGTEVMHDDGLDGDLVAGDGIFTWHAIIAAPGNYGWKPVFSGTWDAWGSDNRSVNSADQTYTTTEPNQNVYMYLNKNTGRMASSAQPSLRLNFIALVEGFLKAADTLMIPDTMTVELRNAASPYTLVNSKQVLLDDKGNGTVYFNNPNELPYWIVLKHRNSIETWSWNTITFTGSVFNYDFTWTSGAAYGNNLVLKLGKYCLYSGDINQDGQVTFTDLSAIDNDNTNFVTGNTVTDLTGDLQVTFSDLTIVDNNNTNFIVKAIPPGAPSRPVQKPNVGGNNKL